MRHIYITFFIISMLFSCKNGNKTAGADTNQSSKTVAMASFGKEIIADDAVAVESMVNHYKSMNIGDSIPAKMTATVDKVCQAKGCWMVLKTADSSEIMVKFKDYGFFMPKDIAGKDVIVNGLAYVKEVPVDELRHYAEDAGKSAEEIAQITTPKRTFSFEADGVLLKN